MSFRINRAHGGRDLWFASIGKNGFNRQAWHKSRLIASLIVWLWLLRKKLPHIHHFVRVGDWTGYVATKRCRCGKEKQYDIY